VKFGEVGFDIVMTADGTPSSSVSERVRRASDMALRAGSTHFLLPLPLDIATSVSRGRGYRRMPTATRVLVVLPNNYLY